MLKEIIDAVEEWTDTKCLITRIGTANIYSFWNNDFREFHILDGRIEEVKSLSIKKLIILCEILRGNIFWKDKEKTKYFNFFIDMDETNLNGWLEHFEFMKTNLKDDEDDKHITYKESVIKWILKYKFGGKDD